MPPVPKAVRVKTASGWQDIAVAGPPGAPGASGAMQLIEEQILSAAAPTIDFQNIPQSFANLLLVGTINNDLSAGNGRGMELRFNNDSAAVYFWQSMNCFGTTVVAEKQDVGATSARFAVTWGGGNNSGCVFRTEFPNYRSAAFNRRFFSQMTGWDNTAFNYRAMGGFFQRPDPISRITLLIPAGGNYIAGSSVALYGIAGAGSVITPPPLVTSLPASPADGAEVYYLADATNGVIWHLRYRAASASAYKWEYVGGPPMSHQIATTEAYANAAAGDLATVGPQLTNPLAGDYTIAWGARVQLPNVAAAVEGWMGLYQGGVNTTWAASHLPTAQYGASTASMQVRITALPAGTQMRCRYSTQASYQFTFGQRWMEMTPVRVG